MPPTVKVQLLKRECNGRQQTVYMVGEESAERVGKKAQRVGKESAHGWGKRALRVRKDSE
jgi:predicted ATP-dependent serine protease